MPSKKTRAEILQRLLQTLVDGWGYDAVADVLKNIEASSSAQDNEPERKKTEKIEASVVQMVVDMSLPHEKKSLLLELAERFDQGSAFPKIADVRSFLIAHRQDPRELKSRAQAFKRMLPVLDRMSEKGLQKVISRSHYSGPAELEAISEAIRGAGEDLRGVPRTERLSEASDNAGHPGPPTDNSETKA